MFVLAGTGFAALTRGYYYLSTPWSGHAPFGRGGNRHPKADLRPSAEFFFQLRERLLLTPALFPARRDFMWIGIRSFFFKVCIPGMFSNTVPVGVIFKPILAVQSICDILGYNYLRSKLPTISPII
ncbi:MAG: hypothetical protein K9M57_11605 [Phycisphaerae bacterium]|nr:hypothetical protein [Phycisphaerae bacterium]